MIDFHNHVLPGVDDGAKDLAMAINMLKTASSQGITDVINTIHFQHPKMDKKNVDYLYIQSKFNKLQEAIDKESIAIKIHMGAEVFYLSNLTEIKSDPLTVFGHGKYMLIEFQTYQLPPGYDEELYSLLMSGTTPIIAHPERYRPIQNEINIIEKLINSGCLMQIDAGSLLGQFGKDCKKTVETMLKRNMVHFMGSDSHNDGKRNFCLESAAKMCEELIGDMTTLLIYDNPKKLLIGEKIEPFEIIDIKDNTSFINKMLNWKS